MNFLTNPFLQKNAIELFTLVLTNINCILQADPDLTMYNMQGCCYAALMRPKKVETRLQLHLGRWPCGDRGGGCLSGVPYF